MIRILLADDHEIVREGLAYILEREPEIRVVAQADSGRSALQLAIEHRPDVVLMDMGMPDMNGIEATRRIVAEVANCKVLMLSMYSDKRFVQQALDAGVRGYLVKGCASAELLNAIRTIVRDELYVGSKIVEAVVNSYARQLGGGLPAPVAELSPREREVLQLVAEGKNTKEIALMLEIGTKTVETYRQQLMKKLNIFNVAKLTRYAIREGVTSLED